jgi:hypothetical protein
VTPLVELAVLALASALVLGRWPSPRSRDDARLFLTLGGIAIATCPVVGPMLFYRPYTGNYLYPVASLLLLLLPYRCHAEAPRAVRWWSAPALLVLGIAVGLGNEHTGVAVLAALLCAVTWFVRRGDRLAVWMIAGIAGVAVGYVALLLAPGHAFRYGGLAHEPTLAVIARRGLGGNARIAGQLVLHVAIALPWVAAAFALRRRGVDAMSRARVLASWVLAGAGILATLALYASPIVGDRLYVASTLLVAAPLAGWVDAHVAARRASAVLSVAALVVVFARCLWAYHALGAAGRERIDLLEHAAPGSAVVLPRLPVERSYWNVGEDLDDPARRALLAHDFGLTSIELR